MKEYVVYIIHSTQLNVYYYGHSSDLRDRMTRHNQNRSKATKGKGPWEIAATTKCETKSEAYRLEMKLKRMKNPKKAINYLKRLNKSAVEHPDD